MLKPVKILLTWKVTVCYVYPSQTANKVVQTGSFQFHSDPLFVAMDLFFCWCDFAKAYGWSITTVLTHGEIPTAIIQHQTSDFAIVQMFS